MLKVVLDALALVVWPEAPLAETLSAVMLRVAEFDALQLAVPPARGSVITLQAPVFVA